MFADYERAFLFLLRYKYCLLTQLVRLSHLSQDLYWKIWGALLTYKCVSTPLQK